MAQKINLENTQITFRNLAGAPTEFNKAGGVRTFAAILSEPVAEQLAGMGFDIRRFVNKETGEPGEAYLKVKINFKNDEDGNFNGPYVYLVTQDNNGKNINKKLLTPATVGIVDRADIKYCDLTITPYRWTVRNESGVSAYLVKMFVIIQEDPLEARYAMIDDNLDEQAEDEIPFE